MICSATLQDMVDRFGQDIERLTNMELDALAHLCLLWKEEEE